MTRRERQRVATIEEIKAAALEQIANEGGSALAIRGVARAIGMSPAGIYRYYDGLDALLTELIADAYNDLATAVEDAAAEPGTSTQRLRLAMLAYRRWAVGQPNRFLLVFGTPIPGYSAPVAGPTVAANRRLGGVFFGLIAQGSQAGQLRLPEATRPLYPSEELFAAESLPGFPAAKVSPILGAWAAFHGMVALEVGHQLDWIYPDAQAFYAGEIDRLLASWSADHSG